MSPLTAWITKRYRLAAACIRRQAGRALVVVVTHQREHARQLTEDIRHFTGPPLKPSGSSIAGLS